MTIAERQKPAPGALFLDHVSHFVPDLDAAAAVLEKLGLRVTPISHQETPEGPVGAANRCAMLEEGYIELLTPTRDTPSAQRMRERIGLFTGVHLACFGTPDAEAEHLRLTAHGFEPQPLVHLEREVEDGRRVRFNVVRVPADRMPEGRIQFVQQLTPEHLWQDRYVNRRISLSTIYVVADEPAATAARWAHFAGLLPRREAATVRLDTARGCVVLASRSVLSRRLGHAPRAPALAGYGLTLPNPGEFADRCAAQGLAVREHGDRYSVVLPRALGGAWVF